MEQVSAPADASPLKLHEAPLPKIAIGDLAARVCGLAHGERLTLIGIGRDDVGNAVRTSPLSIRGALLVEPLDSRTPEVILARLLDDLSDIALERWPRWYGRNEETEQGILEHATGDPLVSAPWVRAAVKRAGTGYRPRFRKVAKGIEFVQLMRAIDPLEPILIAAVDPVAPARATSMIQVLEWCAAQGASVVATFTARPPLLPPYDRVLYGALEVIRAIEPARSRFIPARGRAHHASTVEQRVEAALQRDAELGPLFSCNETVSIRGFDSPPRVDLLWREGRVVVELDGPDHQEDPKFANDRHRDYELLLAGYLVLRITNDQVETDLQRAIEKIRAVVRFRQSTKEVQS
jgi:very-short-patch-repair endonuclease